MPLLLPWRVQSRILSPHTTSRHVASSTGVLSDSACLSYPTFREHLLVMDCWLIVATRSHRLTPEVPAAIVVNFEAGSRCIPPPYFSVPCTLGFVNFASGCVPRLQHPHVLLALFVLRPWREVEISFYRYRDSSTLPTLAAGGSPGISAYSFARMSTSPRARVAPAPTIHGRPVRVLRERLEPP